MSKRVSYLGKTGLQYMITKLKTGILEIVFPIGSTYITQTNTNPKTILGFGTWERLKGKVCLGIDENDSNLNVAKKTGGEKTHTLTISEIAWHEHNYYRDPIWAGEEITWGTLGEARNNANGGYVTGKTQGTGGNQPHNNMQPYEVVGYMWIRRV